MIKQTHELPVVLTSFAYREEYFSELEGMLATARRHHPNWIAVVGKGPIADFDLPTLDVYSPLGRQRWSLPISLNLDGSADDWRKIAKMKGWWINRVWHTFGHLSGDVRRILWLDADARLNGPLDIELHTAVELVAGPWWSDSHYPGYETIATGLLLLQGSSNGTVEDILRRWSDACLAHIQKLSDPPMVPWGDCDQEVLSQILRVRPQSNAHYVLFKLEASRYGASVSHDGVPLPGALVDQWMMARKMKWPNDRHRNWPPPEHVRRGPGKEKFGARNEHWQEYLCSSLK
ncbi:MAG: hypothetical protein LAO78_10190 [Acidobacteriia bacterium]|nr:hypothetical protein [Terriglobia bacterium]